MAHLINPFQVQQICSEMEVADKDFAKLALKLQEKGRAAASEFPKYYEMARKKTFKANYRVYLSIDGEERSELAQAEEEQKRHQQEVKEGKRTKLEVSDQFDLLVDKHVKGEVELATEALKNNLYETEQESKLD